MNTTDPAATVPREPVTLASRKEPDDSLFAPYSVHPHAKRYPLPESKECLEIVDDSRAHGLRKPIVITRDGKWIVDGRVRLLACKEARVEPRFTKLSAEHTDRMIWNYIWSANLYRRHLTSDQRAVLAASYAEEIALQAKQRQKQHGGTAHERKRTLPPEQGGCVSASPRARETTMLAASRHHVSKDKVQQAITLRRRAPFLYKQVEQGAVSLAKAWRAYQPPETSPNTIELNQTPISELSPIPDETSGTNGGARKCESEQCEPEHVKAGGCAEELRRHAAQLKDVFDVFTRMSATLVHLSVAERQLIWARAEAMPSSPAVAC